MLISFLQRVERWLGLYFKISHRRWSKPLDQTLKIKRFGQLGHATPEELPQNSFYLFSWTVSRSGKPTARIYRRISSTSSASATISRRRRSPELFLAVKIILSPALSASMLSRSPVLPSQPLARKTSSGKNLALFPSSGTGLWCFD